MFRRNFAVSCLAAGLVSAGAVAEASAQPLPAIDSVRLLDRLAVLAHDSMAGRRSGSPGNLRARAFLERAMAGTGAEPVGGGHLHAFEWPRGRGANVVGLLPGRSGSDQLIVMTAHYDHLGVRQGEVFNGADDNASGTIALLEIAHQLASDPLDHAVLLALVDAEELGSHGARAIVDDELVPPGRIALNVNLDMVSRTGGVLWAAGAYHTPELNAILEAVAATAPLTLRQGHDRPGAPEGDDWTASSDHAAFHDAGIPFVYFGVEDHEDYHRPTDDVERVDAGEYVAAVRTILMALRSLDAALPLEGPDP